MAALETLAIVAYRQPVTGPEVAELRSVNSSSSIRTLLDRKLITTAGRKEVVGTPFLYKTTKEFLVHFGLKGLGDLPKPEELEAIYGLEAPKAGSGADGALPRRRGDGRGGRDRRARGPGGRRRGGERPAVRAGLRRRSRERGRQNAPTRPPGTPTENENEAEPAAAPEEERHDG